MGRFNRAGRRQIPTLNTAALPDLIFTLLFFFMIVTTMRKAPVGMEVEPPRAAQVETFRRVQETVVYIGRPVTASRAQSGDTVCIQVDGRSMSPAQLETYLRCKMESLSVAERAEAVVSLKADKQTPMGVVADVKKALRKAGALRVRYFVVGSE